MPAPPGDPNIYLLRPASDQIPRPLPDHDHSGVGVPRDQLGHDGGIRHPETLDTPRAQTGIDYGHGVLAHAAGARLMVHGERGEARKFAQFRVTLRHVAWRPLSDYIILNSGLCDDPTGHLHAFHELLDIVRLANEGGLDLRRVHW